MEYTTSMSPQGSMAKFYMCFPVDILEQRESVYLSFKLPAGKKFPTNLLSHEKNGEGHFLYKEFNYRHLQS